MPTRLQNEDFIKDIPEVANLFQTSELNSEFKVW